jgi:hypothetical protein
MIAILHDNIYSLRSVLIVADLGLGFRVYG